MKDGCPAGNLTQEMSPLNEDFRQALSKLSEAYKNAMKVAIENGQKNGVLKQDIQSDQVAVFVLSGYWGIRTYGKVASDNNCYNVYLEELKAYLNDLLKK